MIIKACSVVNFGSYPHLEFNFDESGLTLISGPTGSGKSTLCDIIPWCLYGRTAKDGNADEIRSWGTEEATEGIILVDDIAITRVRGKVNDLFITHADGTVRRGKDLKDTQFLINLYLKCDVSLYLSAAYLNEFSSTSAFFVANAKIRRSIVEQLVDLSFTKELTNTTTEYRKDLKEYLDNTDTYLSMQRYDVDNNNQMMAELIPRSDKWKLTNANALTHAKTNHENFESIRKKGIDQLSDIYIDISKAITADRDELFDNIKSDEFFSSARESYKNQLNRLGALKCPTCGNHNGSDQRLVITKELNKLDMEEAANKQAKIQVTRLNLQLVQEEKKYSKARDAQEEKENNWDYEIARLKSEVNPYEPLIEGHKETLVILNATVTKLQSERDATALAMADCDQLLEILSNFRELQTKNTIVSIEHTTNELLSQYFDAEIKVAFETDGCDKVEVTIFKDGNTCVYSQLSKGQRQLLRLAFGVAVMKHISKHHALSFSAVFFDEVFTGLDSTLIAKGFSMLRSLQADYQSIYVVEHNEEAKAMADSKIEVKLLNGVSILEKS